MHQRALISLENGNAERRLEDLAFAFSLFAGMKGIRLEFSKKTDGVVDDEGQKKDGAYLIVSPTKVKLRDVEFEHCLEYLSESGTTARFNRYLMDFPFH